MGVLGVVEDLGSIGRSDCGGGIGQPALVSSPHIGIRNIMAALCYAISYSRNAPLGAIEPDKDKVDFIPDGFGRGDQVEVTLPGQRGLVRKTDSGGVLAGGFLQDLAAGCYGCGGWIHRIQSACDCVRIQ